MTSAGDQWLTSRDDVTWWSVTDQQRWRQLVISSWQVGMTSAGDQWLTNKDAFILNNIIDILIDQIQIGEVGMDINRYYRLVMVHTCDLSIHGSRDQCEQLIEMSQALSFILVYRCQYHSHSTHSMSASHWSEVRDDVFHWSAIRTDQASDWPMMDSQVENKGAECPRRH